MRAATVTRVPFFDLGPSHAEVKAPILEEIDALVDEGSFTNGRQVAEFESAFAAFCGIPHAVGLANGLDALRLTLVAAGLRPGDEVVVPANTFVATFEAVTQAGGRPVPADVSERDYNLDPEAAAAALSERTRFVIPVHLYGQMADMPALAALADRHGLTVVEDACQAHGAVRAGLVPGEAGLAAAFSFYPAKNLGAFGDAGALVTGAGDLAEQIRALRDHGQRSKYLHEAPGFTARLDTIQAIVLLHKLPLLERWNAERRAIAAFYLRELAGVGDLLLPPLAPDSDPVWHQFVVRTTDPQSLAKFLRDRGIGTGRHYPEPPHLSAAYATLGYGSGSFPVSERLAAEVLSLPIFPGLRPEHLEAVAAGVRAYFERA